MNLILSFNKISNNYLIIVYIVTDVIVVFLDNRLIKAGGLLEFVLLHEEHVRHVQLPHVALVAKLDAFAEDFLDLREQKCDEFFTSKI